MPDQKAPTRLHLGREAGPGMQMCFNAVVRGLHHQRWVSDGYYWSPEHGPKAEAVHRGERSVMYSPMGWLIKEGRHKKVFDSEWGDYAIMKNSHRDMYPWFWYLTWKERGEVQRMLKQMRWAYSYHEGRPRELHLALGLIASDHKLKWPADVPTEYEGT